MEEQASPALPDTMPTAPSADDDVAPVAPDTFLPPMARGQKKATMPDKVKAEEGHHGPVDPWNSRQS
jgi:hypothetical protein